MEMKVLVCGGRKYDDANTFFRVMDFLHETTSGDGISPGFTLVIHGGAPGADSLADRWARARGVPVEAHPADWSLGRSAGPARNRRMLARKPDLVIAFPGGRGTAHMVSIARKAGVEVWMADECC